MTIVQSRTDIEIYDGLTKASGYAWFRFGPWARLGEWLVERFGLLLVLLPVAMSTNLVMVLPSVQHAAALVPHLFMFTANVAFLFFAASAAIVPTDAASLRMAQHIPIRNTTLIRDWMRNAVFAHWAVVTVIAGANLGLLWQGETEIKVFLQAGWMLLAVAAQFQVANILVGRRGQWRTWLTAWFWFATLMQIPSLWMLLNAPDYVLVGLTPAGVIQPLQQWIADQCGLVVNAAVLCTLVALCLGCYSLQPRCGDYFSISQARQHIQAWNKLLEQETPAVGQLCFTRPAQRSQQSEPEATDRQAVDFLRARKSSPSIWMMLTAGRQRAYRWATCSFSLIFTWLIVFPTFASGGQTAGPGVHCYVSITFLLVHIPATIETFRLRSQWNPVTLTDSDLAGIAARSAAIDVAIAALIALPPAIVGMLVCDAGMSIAIQIAIQTGISLIVGLAIRIALFRVTDLPTYTHAFFLLLVAVICGFPLSFIDAGLTRGLVIFVACTMTAPILLFRWHRVAAALDRRGLWNFRRSGPKA